jgi:hypothetical protein
MMTEKEKMLAGMEYSATDEELLRELNAVKEVIHDYNLLRPSDRDGKLQLLKQLLGHIGDDAIIGMKSIITHDVQANTLNVGSPAKQIREGVSWAKSNPNN